MKDRPLVYHTLNIAELLKYLKGEGICFCLTLCWRHIEEDLLLPPTVFFSSCSLLPSLKQQPLKRKESFKKVWTKLRPGVTRVENDATMGWADVSGINKSESRDYVSSRKQQKTNFFPNKKLCLAKLTELLDNHQVTSRQSDSGHWLPTVLVCLGRSRS